MSGRILPGFIAVLVAVLTALIVFGGFVSYRQSVLEARMRHAVEEVATFGETTSQFPVVEAGLGDAPSGPHISIVRLGGEIVAINGFDEKHENIVYRPVR